MILFALENGAADGVDGVLIFDKTVFHFNFVFCTSIVVVKFDLGVDFRGGQTGVSQCNLFCFVRGDVVGAGIVACTFLYCTIAAVHTVTTATAQFRTKAKEESKSQAIAITRDTQNYQYWEATRVKNTVVTGRGLTFSEARVRVASGSDIMCANQGAALWLVISNGYWNAVGPEIHGDDGYFWHYHPNRNSHVHIWYF